LRRASLFLASTNCQRAAFVVGEAKRNRGVFFVGVFFGVVASIGVLDSGVLDSGCGVQAGVFRGSVLRRFGWSVVGAGHVPYTGLAVSGGSRVVGKC
jgi:hypothetical protein